MKVRDGLTVAALMSVQRISKTYNIHYQRMDEDRWDALEGVYERLPGFIGSPGDIPYWFGVEPDGSDREPDVSPGYLWASAEPSGLLVEGWPYVSPVS